jgi:hypothetical protein
MLLTLINSEKRGVNKKQLICTRRHVDTRCTSVSHVYMVAYGGSTTLANSQEEGRSKVCAGSKTTTHNVKWMQ